MLNIKSLISFFFLFVVFESIRAEFDCAIPKSQVTCYGDYDQESNFVRSYSLVDSKPVTRNECPSGWTFYGRTQSCYYVGVAKAYAAASLYCGQQNAYLAYIESPEENDFIVSLATLDISMGPQDMTWIGYQLRDGRWQWENSRATDSYANWIDGKLPDANPNFQSCGILYQDTPIGAGQKTNWNAWNCATLQAKFVCKLESKVKDQNSILCEASPIANIARCKKSKLNPPFVIADTRCPSGWTFYDPTQSCYYVGTRMSFDEAQQLCANKYSSLTSVHTADENQFIANLAQANKKMGPTDQTWIGLQYNGNQWTWLDGTTLDYQNFVDNITNLDRGFTCGSLLADDYNEIGTPLRRLQWNNAVCAEAMRKFVCKRKKYPDWGITQ